MTPSDRPSRPPRPRRCALLTRLPCPAPVGRNPNFTGQLHPRAGPSDCCRWRRVAAVHAEPATRPQAGNGAHVAAGDEVRRTHPLLGRGQCRRARRHRIRQRAQSRTPADVPVLRRRRVRMSFWLAVWCAAAKRETPNVCWLCSGRRQGACSGKS